VSTFALLGGLIGFSLKPFITKKRRDAMYWLMLVPRALPLGVCFLIGPNIYKSFDWGNYQFVAKLFLKDLLTAFLF
jgi:hypothetical protein